MKDIIYVIIIAILIRWNREDDVKDEHALYERTNFRKNIDNEISLASVCWMERRWCQGITLLYINFWKIFKIIDTLKYEVLKRQPKLFWFPLLLRSLNISTNNRLFRSMVSSIFLGKDQKDRSKNNVIDSRSVSSWEGKSTFTSQTQSFWTRGDNIWILRSWNPNCLYIQCYNWIKLNRFHAGEQMFA